MAIYWVDTSAFVEAKRKWYPFERIPQFWKFVAGKIQSGEVRCTQFIFEELVAGNDYLAQWVKDRKQDGLCYPMSPDVYTHYTTISDYITIEATYPRYQIDEFMRSSDGWLIAQAMAVEGAVVTQESRSRRKKIRIPTVCKRFGLRSVDLPTMLHELDFRIT